MRFETVAALQDVQGDSVKATLVAVTKDRNPRVRARALQALGARKDPTLSATYEAALGDESYGVIRAAAAALGQTKSSSAYEPLMKLFDTSSWRDNIRISGLNALVALGDKRALDAALKYSSAGNSSQTRAAAISLLGAVGKDDARVFSVVSDTLLRSASPYNSALFGASGRALVELGDQRGLEVFEQAGQKTTSPRAKTLLQQLVQQLKQKAQPATSKSPEN